MSVPKTPYIMDYISDKNVYKAVMWACQMIRQGKTAPTAARISAYYYKVDFDDVIKYVAQRGGRK